MKLIEVKAKWLDGKNKLTTDELYMYAYLYSRRSIFEGTVIVSESLLCETIPLGVLRETARKRISEAFNGLIEKGAITTELVGGEHFGNYVVNFKEIKGDKLYIPYSKLELSPVEFHIYAYVLCVDDGDRGTWISTNYWAEEVLNTYSKTTKGVLKKAIDKGIVAVEEGTHFYTTVEEKLEKTL